eukprot:Hpha_TRINITY_DN34387_c0_g1::TRINITY_DN34387_c0_g1_i1::g.109611::m.109611
MKGWVGMGKWSVAVVLGALLGHGEGLPQCDVPSLRTPFINFTQPIEHSSPDKGTFQQRTQLIDHFYKPGGPVLFYAGPENAWSPATLACLSLWKHAEALGAAMIGAEHRFFGESFPAQGSKDWSPLTLDNVMKDYVAVVRNYTGPGGKYEGAKVAVFGGSYGGFLSMVLRVRYPEVFAGSIASAAPTQLYGSGVAEGTWFDTVASIYQSRDTECATKLSESFQELIDGISTNPTQIQAALGLCTPPSAVTAFKLKYYAAHAVSVVTQFNYPEPAVDSVGLPFQAACSSLKQGSPLQGLRSMLDFAYNSTKKPLECFNWEGKSSALGRPSLGDINFALSWSYICCTFYFMPIAGSQLATDFFHFSIPFSLEGQTQRCVNLFGVKPDTTPKFLPSELNGASNIFFSNFFYDPVKAFSLQSNVSDSVTLTVLPNAGHTQDLLPFPGNPPDVVAAIAQEQDVLRKWFA